MSFTISFYVTYLMTCH